MSTQPLLRPDQATWSTRRRRGYCMHVDTSTDDDLDFACSLARTLDQHPRWLECKYLYDATGSELFESITAQPEYYQTRTEDRILSRYAGEIREQVGARTLVELGSGSSSKTRHLLDAWRAAGSSSPTRYLPLDVSSSALELACDALLQRYPTLRLEPVAATYARGVPLARQVSPLMLVFLGSSIGNFNEAESDAFLAMVAANLQVGDYFLVGIDLVKEPSRLEAAYNDQAGVTARFIQNLFARIGREFDADIDEQATRHVAYYNDARQRIEIYAECQRELHLNLHALGRRFRFAKGERVLVEISRKFRVEDLATDCARFGLVLRQAYHDDAEEMAVVLLERR